MSGKLMQYCTCFHRVPYPNPSPQPCSRPAPPPRQPHSLEQFRPLQSINYRRALAHYVVSMILSRSLFSQQPAAPATVKITPLLISQHYRCYHYHCIVMLISLTHLIPSLCHRSRCRRLVQQANPLHKPRNHSMYWHRGSNPCPAEQSQKRSWRLM